MNESKIELLKKDITNNIVNDFNMQIDEVLSICESEIEKLLLLHLYRYFQKFRKKGEWFNEFSNIDFIEDEIILNDPFVSTLENVKLQERVRRYDYRWEDYHFLKNIGFKVRQNQSEPISVDFSQKSKSNSTTYDDVIFREFEVRPQYPVTIDGVEFRLDIAIILNRKMRKGNIIESKKIALECDGYDYHSSPEQKRNDDIRTRKLKKNGWKEVLRYSGKELHSLNNIKEVNSLFEEIIDIIFI